jgi:ATP-dependent NAD(P)H-hydrate dehydratase
MILGCIAGSLLLRKAASLGFEKNKRSTVTTDIIDFLGQRSVVTCI